MENLNISEIDILKIDTEGHELEVLKGAKSVLKKVNYLHIELNQCKYTVGELFKLISDNDIKVEMIDIRVFEKIGGHVKSADLFLKLNNI